MKLWMALDFYIVRILQQKHIHKPGEIYALDTLELIHLEELTGYDNHYLGSALNFKQNLEVPIK